MISMPSKTTSEPTDKQLDKVADKTADKTNDKLTDKQLDARNRNLDLAISQIQKEFGEAAIMRLGDDSCVDVDVIPTGNLLIDRALGVGGFKLRLLIKISNFV